MGSHTIDRFATGVIINSHILMLVTGVQMQRLLMLLHVSGAIKTIGGVPLIPSPRLLRCTEVTKACGTLIVPQWISAPFWTLLFPDGTQPAKFVTGICELPQVEVLFVSDRSGGNLFNGVPNTPVLAL